MGSGCVGIVVEGGSVFGGATGLGVGFRVFDFNPSISCFTVSDIFGGCGVSGTWGLEGGVSIRGGVGGMVDN